MSSRPIHGSINPIELKILGLEKKELIDFSANISPIGQPDGVWETIKSVDLITIMTALGGRHALQELLGVGASAISNYLARGKVPTHVQSKLYKTLVSLGYHVRPDNLQILKT